MILGLSLAAFTDLHTIISLVGIAAGIVFFGALALSGHWRATANGLFLIFTILTSVTGFLFPWKGVTPAVIFGVISLGLFAIALFALYGRGAAGGWRKVYLAAALIAQWLNMVVLIVQSYQKVPALHALAPLGNEPVILASQAVLLAIVAFTGWRVLFTRRAVAV
jgi:hypothetical protein